MRVSKYHSKKITVNGEKFDSKKEYSRWCELKILERAGRISSLRRQVPFLLIHEQKIDGKVVERECKYIADFVYYDTTTGHWVVEDTKGVRTEAYRIKRKLMLQVWGVRIKET